MYPFVQSAYFASVDPKMNSTVKPAVDIQLSTERLES